MKTFSEYYRENRTNLDAVLFDIDGTLIHGGVSALPNAPEIIDTLNKNNCPYFIFTNGVTQSCAQRAEQLQRNGLNTTEKHIISAGHVLQKYLLDHNCCGQTFFQCGDLGDPNYAHAVGVHTVRSFREREKCSGVIIGGGALNNRSEFEAAFNLLLERPDLPCLTVNPDDLWRANTGFRIGDGSVAKFMVSLLKNCNINLEMLYLGKPYSPIYSLALQKISELLPGREIRPERIIAIGDYLQSDIAGANRAGMISALVLTGMSDLKAAKNAPQDFQPQMIFSTL